ncbi:hypothetical protein BC941DRAFT_388030 [Chlamydoabsidia padenii]|nr:hypothetical protein BC941DRAFT_388030 [Chlamydoabsidia padenii]
MLSRQWLITHCTIYKAQYVFLGILLVGDYSVIQRPGWIIKTILGIALILSLFIPYIRRFTKPALPVFGWVITFYACQFIPNECRPNHIFVNILPTLERVLYGASLSEIISKHTHPILDILAWLPYGVIHFTFPFILVFILFLVGPPKSANVFGQAFGYMNLAGVLTQLVFPNASPWYEMTYGSSPADYSIHGEPGGLARIDDILGLKLYKSTFGGSPLVFGAFPSLHSGSATIEMLFVTYLYPKLWPLGVLYTMWLWWSTMYLTHHYLIDLVGGSIYAFLTFFVARQFLPQVDPSKSNRLAYFTGIPNNATTFYNFIHSIEYTRCFGQEHNKLEDIEQGVLFDTIDPYQDVYVLMEPNMKKYHRCSQQQWDGTPIRMRNVDIESRLSDDDDDDISPALVSSHTSPNCSEPESPVAPFFPDPCIDNYKR